LTVSYDGGFRLSSIDRKLDAFTLRRLTLGRLFFHLVLPTLAVFVSLLSIRIHDNGNIVAQLVRRFPFYDVNHPTWPARLCVTNLVVVWR
jgi:hypothetical protein